MALFEEPRDRVLVQQADILGKEGHEHLQDESLRSDAVHLAGYQLIEANRQSVGGLAGDRLVVVAEDRLLVGRKQERQRSPTVRQLGQGEAIDGRIHLGLEVVNPERIEVAKDDVARPARHQSRPIIERLPVMAHEILAAALHFD